MSVNKVNQSTGALSPIAGGTLYADAPVGSIQAYGGTTAPWGWLLCQGQAVSRTTYAELFGVIGTSFGEGDGSTTFNVPDLRESTIKGAGLTGKSSNHLDADGLALGEFIDDRIQSHTHTYTDVHSGTNAAYGRADFTGGAEKYNFDGFTLTSSAPTGRSGVTTEVKAVGVNFIIKAISIALPTDFASAVDDKIAANIVDSITDGNMKAATSNAVYDALFKGVSNYDSSHPVVDETLTTETVKSVEVTAIEDNTIYYIYAGNGSNNAVSYVVLTVRMNDKTIYVNRIINTNYGVVTYTTPPIKKGVKVNFQTEAKFTSGTANLYVYKLT